VAPCAGRDAKLDRNVRNLEVFPQSPVFQPHTESDASGVTMVVIYGVHGGGEGTRSLDRLLFSKRADGLCVHWQVIVNDRTENDA
jgi:hypothetical protein